MSRYGTLNAKRPVARWMLIHGILTMHSIVRSEVDKMGEHTRKLLTLRARTDRDLLVLINRELDRGFSFLDAATTRNSPLFAQAKKAFATATTMLPKIVGLSADELQRTEAKAKELRFRMD